MNPLCVWSEFTSCWNNVTSRTVSTGSPGWSLWDTSLVHIWCGGYMSHPSVGKLHVFIVNMWLFLVTHPWRATTTVSVRINRDLNIGERWKESKGGIKLKFKACFTLTEMYLTDLQSEVREPVLWLLHWWFQCTTLVRFVQTFWNYPDDWSIQSVVLESLNKILYAVLCSPRSL